VWEELQAAKVALEREFGDMQSFEFAVEDGRLFFLQTRDGKRTPWAAVRIAADLVREGLATKHAALERLPADCREILDRFFRRDESYRTISADLDLPAGTVASRIARCLTRLRDALETGRNPPPPASGEKVAERR